MKMKRILKGLRNSNKAFRDGNNHNSNSELGASDLTGGRQASLDNAEEEEDDDHDDMVFDDSEDMNSLYTDVHAGNSKATVDTSAYSELQRFYSDDASATAGNDDNNHNNNPANNLSNTSMNSPTRSTPVLHKPPPLHPQTNNNNNNNNNTNRANSNNRADETRNLVKKFIADIWNRGELDLIPSVCSPSLRFNGNTGFDRVGHDGLARMVATIRDSLDEYHCEIHSMVVEDNKAFCRLRFTGKHVGPLLGYPPTYKTVAWMGATEFTIQNQKILKVWELGDVKCLEEQLAKSPVQGDDEM